MKIIENSAKFAQQIRKLSLNMVHNAGASHIGSVLSIADILAVLYNDFLDISASNFSSTNRDRFILSKGHACIGVYSALNILGIIKDSELVTYGKDFSSLMHHISHKVDGVEFSTGSLGHGLPYAVGKSLAAKILKKNWKTVVLLGDGELNEGSNWEAVLFGAHHRLDNLTLIIDFNNLQSLTSTDETLSLRPLKEKFLAFLWSVIEIDGHNYEEILSALHKSSDGKPKCIIAKTIKGKGVSFMENKVKWHYKTPNVEELKKALLEIDNA